ncbi:rCG61161 [Rattus norvegicus]|uniref:RCG61161 n=1 Tax=Rattus norvegicus TaxID=10116 RepID=A6KEH8_RAT|nr:rCG61161 [Rattus norvegicus]
MLRNFFLSPFSSFPGLLPSPLPFLLFLLLFLFIFLLLLFSSSSPLRPQSPLLIPMLRIESRPLCVVGKCVCCATPQLRMSSNYRPARVISFVKVPVASEL